MAWPFTSASPSYDSGFVTVSQAVANPAGAGDGTTYWLMGANFANAGLNDAYITLMDGSGNAILPSIRIAPNFYMSMEWPFMPLVGLRWQASAPNVTGKIWGYQ